MMNASLPVLGLPIENAGGDEAASLCWLWQVVAATSCWAMSDVVCDMCIKKSDTKSVEGKPGGEVVFDLSIEEEPTQLRLVSPPSQAATADRKPRQRKGKGPKVLDPAAIAARPNGHPMSPRSRGLPPLSVVPQLNLAECGQLTPEQNALLSGCISLCAAAGVGLSQHRPADLLAAASTLGRPDILAAVGGCFHFSAYLATLCAFSSASSTVITPLMQLSAMWMLPFSMSAALLGFAAFIRPVHLLSVALICTGGFLPAADGCLASVASSSFWRQSAVRYVVLGELLICCYNVLLHQATFGLFSLGAEEQAASALQSDSDPLSMGSPLRFFVISRTMNGLCCMCLFFTVPSLRAHVYALRNVGKGFLATSLLGECLSTLGVWFVTFSYSAFYEPSVVNAVEGGLQQLFNLLFALGTHRFLGWGRGVDQVPVKVVSFVLVASGLYLSTL